MPQYRERPIGPDRAWCRLRRARCWGSVTTRRNKPVRSAYRNRSAPSTGDFPEISTLVASRSNPATACAHAVVPPHRTCAARQIRDPDENHRPIQEWILSSSSAPALYSVDRSWGHLPALSAPTWCPPADDPTSCQIFPTSWLPAFVHILMGHNISTNRHRLPYP